MKLITFITLIIVNCIIALANPALERPSIGVSGDFKNGFRSDISYPEDYFIANKLQVDPDCIVTANGGANVVLGELYENDCALISFSDGLFLRDYKYNCCGESGWIRVNNKDWFNIKSQGKLDGLRFSQAITKGDSYEISFHKVVGKESTSISGEDFLP